MPAQIPAHMSTHMSTHMSRIDLGVAGNIVGNTFFVRAALVLLVRHRVLVVRDDLVYQLAHLRAQLGDARQVNARLDCRKSQK